MRNQENKSILAVFYLGHVVRLDRIGLQYVIVEGLTLGTPTDQPKERVVVPETSPFIVVFKIIMIHFQYQMFSI